MARPEEKTKVEVKQPTYVTGNGTVVPTISEKDAKEQGFMNLRTAAVYAGLTEQRVRNLLREGRLPAHKTLEKGYWRISRKSIDDYHATKGGRNVDGAKSYVIRLTPALLKELRETFLTKHNLVIEPRYKAKKAKTAG